MVPPAYRVRGGGARRSRVEWCLRGADGAAQGAAPRDACWRKGRGPAVAGLAAGVYAAGRD